jgi:hypothetical protein
LIPLPYKFSRILLRSCQTKSNDKVSWGSLFTRFPAKSVRQGNRLLNSTASEWARNRTEENRRQLFSMLRSSSSVIPHLWLGLLDRCTRLGHRGHVKKKRNSTADTRHSGAVHQQFSIVCEW